MKRVSRKVMQVVFGGVMAAALGFGVTEALAAPQPDAVERIICPFGRLPCECPG